MSHQIYKKFCKHVPRIFSESIISPEHRNDQLINHKLYIFNLTTNDKTFPIPKMTYINRTPYTRLLCFGSRKCISLTDHWTEPSLIPRTFLINVFILKQKTLSQTSIPSSCESLLDRRRTTSSSSSSIRSMNENAAYSIWASLWQHWTTCEFDQKCHRLVSPFHLFLHRRRSLCRICLKW